MKRNPGTFHNHSTGVEYVVLNRAAITGSMHPHVILEAVNDGRLPVATIAGCKCVALADLKKLKAEVAE